MNRSTLVIISLLSCAIGVLLFAIQNEWIIIRFSQPIITNIATRHTKKKIDLYYWDANRWHKESEELLWAKETDAQLETLITSWLALIDNECITPKKIAVQSVMLAPNRQEALISFDRAPFAKSWSIQKKMILIESLLKTIRENKVNLSSIQFLVEGQPINDAHLDFSCAWPLSGFMHN